MSETASAKTILYVVQSIPGSNAPTKHAFAIADLLVKCGYEPHFMVAGIADPDLPALKERFDYSVEFPKRLTLGRWRLAAKYAERLTSCASISAFREVMARICPEIVVYYGIQNRLAKAIERECRDAHVPVLVDETDWFETRFDGDIAAWIVARGRELRVRDADEAADGVLAISPFFTEHFRGIEKVKGTPRVMFLPPLNREGEALDEVRASIDVERKATRFFYAGSPVGKDHIDCFIDAMATCSSLLKTAPELDVVGVSQAEGAGLLKRCETDVKVRFHGRLPHEDVIAMLREADFGILFRQPELYARAGFSTKFAECMSNGVPMLCNAVGGADLVLSPGIDGLVVPNLEPSSLIEGLKAACNMDDNALLVMKRAALDKSKHLFEPEGYVEDFSDFLDTLRGAGGR